MLRAPAPHLDYHQNDTERKIFYETYDLPSFYDEPNVLMEVFDNEDEKFGVMLGVWKPIQPDQVKRFRRILMGLGLFHGLLTYGIKHK